MPAREHDDVGREPVLRRTSSVFPRGPVDDSFSGAIDQPGAYDAEREAIQRASGAPVGTHRQIAEEERRVKEGKERSKTNRAKLDLSTALAEQIYVDGRLSTVYRNVVLPDGTRSDVEVLGEYTPDGDSPSGRTLAPGQRREIEARAGARQATFSLLGIEDVPMEARFIMSRGERLNEDGLEWKDTERGREVEQDRLLHGRPSRSRAGVGGKPVATNMMTVAGGVTWFRNLSRNDPAAYAEMIDLLVGSNYMSAEDARKSVYTREAGRAFAYAAADAAQNVEVGSQDDLRTFLQKVAGDATAAEGDEYIPETRRYIDPAALHLTARETAQELLGRGLSEAELAEFTSRFRGIEDSYYDAIDNAGRTKTSARVADPNPTGQADSFVRSPEFDDERTKQLTGSYMDALMDLLGG